MQLTLKLLKAWEQLQGKQVLTEMYHDYVRFCLPVLWKTPGLQWQYLWAKASIILSIFCASPGKRKLHRNCLQRTSQGLGQIWASTLCNRGRVAQSLLPSNRKPSLNTLRSQRDFPLLEKLVHWGMLGRRSRYFLCSDRERNYTEVEFTWEPGRGWDPWTHGGQQMLGFPSLSNALPGLCCSSFQRSFVGRPINLTAFSWIWADSTSLSTSEFIRLLLSCVTSINTRVPVPLASKPALPPLCFTDEVVCFGSRAVPRRRHTFFPRHHSGRGWSWFQLSKECFSRTVLAF